MKKSRFLMLFMLVLTLCLASCGGEKTPPPPAETPAPSEAPVTEVPDDEFYTFMTTSDSRPIAVMIDNNSAARPQSGVENAFAVYEMMVEGGSTRLMAIFKDSDLKKVGPVRSSRHYFLDYVLEHDAIYTHCGWSPQAQSDITTLGINNINELTHNNGKNFFRDSSKKAPHNLYASLPEIISSAKGRGYSLTTDDGNVFSYNKQDTDIENGSDATSVKLPYSNGYTVSYKYNAEKKLYERFINSSPHRSASSSDSLFAKNIIVYKVRNYSTDAYDRQELENIGSGDGYYITNGKMIEISWNKASRGHNTRYTTKDGEPLYINPGNVFVQIVPVNSTITIE